MSAFPPAPAPIVVRGKPQFSPSIAEFVYAAERRKHANPRAIAEGLARVRAAASGVAFAPRRDPAALARAILAEPDLAHPQAKPTPHEKDLLERFFDWLDSILNELFAGLRKATNLSVGASRTLLLVLLAIASFGAIALLIAIVKRRVERRIGPLALARIRIGEDAAATPAQLVIAARARAERGDYAAAIGLIFAAAVRALDERGIVAYDAARTPGEYRRAVRRSQAPFADAFDALTRGFVLAMYGTDATDALDWAGALAAYERLSA